MFLKPYNPVHHQQDERDTFYFNQTETTIGQLCFETVHAVSKNFLKIKVLSFTIALFGNDDERERD